jgi:adenosylcobinamide kinase/adenosylcobinamide-phosphate guanylyltransferase
MEPPATMENLLATTLAEKPDAVIVDCATLWLGWEMSRVFKQYSKTQLMAHMENEIAHFVETLKKIPCPVFVVSNETGCGVVPEHASGRIFRDTQGLLNTLLASHAKISLVCFAGQALLVRNAAHTPADGYFPIAAVTPEWVVKNI